MKIKRQVFNPLKIVTWPSAGRPDGRPRQKSVDRFAQTCTGLIGWRVGRPSQSTARELCYLELAPVDRAVDRQRAAALCIQLWSTGRSTGGTTVIKMTVGPVDRAVDRKGKFALSYYQRADLDWGYKYSISFDDLKRISRAKFSIFQQVFKRV